MLRCKIQKVEEGHQGPRESVATAAALDSMPKGVPMTSLTLQAALKMRCDNSGASYAIYWANQKGSLKAVAAYETAELKAELKSRGVTQSFDQASMDCAFTTTGASPMAES